MPCLAHWPRLVSDLTSLDNRPSVVTGSFIPILITNINFQITHSIPHTHTTSNSSSHAAYSVSVCVCLSVHVRPCPCLSLSFCLSICLSVCVCHRVHVKVRRQFLGIGSLLWPCKSQIPGIELGSSGFGGGQYLYLLSHLACPSSEFSVFSCFHNPQTFIWFWSVCLRMSPRLSFPEAFPMIRPTLSIWGKNTSKSPCALIRGYRQVIDNGLFLAYDVLSDLMAKVVGKPGFSTTYLLLFPFL